MKTAKINQKNPDNDQITKVIEVLNKDGVIVYPTDTIYGLGCKVSSKAGIERIQQIKKRDKKHAMSFICPDFASISQYAIIEDYAFRLMKRLLPGPYTFILRASNEAPRNAVAKGKKTIGVRIPNDAVCLALVKNLGEPILTTSVNITGQEVYNDPNIIAQKFGHQVDIIIDSGVLPTEPSTVIDLTGSAPVVVRQGKGSVDF